MIRVVSLGVVEEVVGVVDLIISQVLEGGHAIDDAGGDVVVCVHISQRLGTCEVLLGNVS